VFIVLLRFAENRARAGELMAAHRAWIDRGFAESAFLLVGSLASGGGGIVAQAPSRDAIEERVGRDPFVAHGVVRAEISEIQPSRVDPRLDLRRPH